MEEKITQLIRFLNSLFWGSFLSSILIGVLLLFLIPNGIIDASLSVNLQSVAILILLACIPLALWLYNKKLVSATLPDDTNLQIASIRQWFIVRLTLVEAAFLFNIIVYALTRNNSLLFCCGIAFLILLFLCRPNKNEIVTILSKNNL